MKTDQPIITHLTDYTPYGFEISAVDLIFTLTPTKTLVTNALTVRRVSGGPKDLFLNGEGIDLLSVSMDPKPGKLKTKRNKLGLTIQNVPDQFTLTIKTVCNPSKNTSLMGLYVSGGRFCTQCEAEGFRRITYFPDRPDVLSRYTVRIEADKAAYPVLLSNGNCISEGDLPNGQHFSVWQDPFPKPCYLFALVAGQFDIVSDTFKTMSGKIVPLDIYVDTGDAPRAQYAMGALKRSMKWDEDVFGREYDLDRFMIVAVRDFNFGAMENKGLNIFNSSLLLADQASATDMNYELIESVIAHEYFHNWSGNRVTCRDWFQLCLKEGFTVFRDQEFSADMRGGALQRIKDVKALRARQFAEDAGPLSHPVRPASYMKIDNFYTATIYEKGAELVRMIKTMLGAKTFREGCDYYFKTYDGTAASVEDFITSFEKESGRDLSQFLLWYAQSGTPKVSIKTKFDKHTKTFTANFTQSTSPTPGQPHKQDLLMPISLGLVSNNGASFGEKIIELSGKTVQVTYQGIAERPTLSAFRKFSAPVTIDHALSTEDSLKLMRYDTDLFNQWEAGQMLGLDIISNIALSIADGNPQFCAKTAQQYIGAMGEILRSKNLDNGYKAIALSPPTSGAVLQNLSNRYKTGHDPLAVHEAITMIRRAMGSHLQSDLMATYKALSAPSPFKPDAQGAGRRSLRNLCLSLLTAAHVQNSFDMAVAQQDGATNMTDELSALLVLVRSGGERANKALNQFYSKWKHSPLPLDKWFAASAQMLGRRGFSHIQNLVEHPDYKGANPNRVRSLIGGFAAANPLNFHTMSGAGYRFYADNILAMDKRNPQVAARLLGAFEIAGKLDTHRQSLIKAELTRILSAKPSANVFEIASKSKRNL